LKLNAKINIIDFGCATLCYKINPAGHSNKYAPEDIIISFQ
jgi:hypothetical protein